MTRSEKVGKSATSDERLIANSQQSQKWKVYSVFSLELEYLALLWCFSQKYILQTWVFGGGDNKLVLLPKLLLSAGCIARLVLLTLLTDCVLLLEVIYVLHFKPWLVNCFY